jgi:hypothetical protein
MYPSQSGLRQAGHRRRNFSKTRRMAFAPKQIGMRSACLPLDVLRQIENHAHNPALIRCRRVLDAIDKAPTAHFRT